MFVAAPRRMHCLHSPARRIWSDQCGVELVEVLVVLVVFALAGAGIAKTLSSGLHSLSLTEGQAIVRALFCAGIASSPKVSAWPTEAPIRATGRGVIDPGQVDPRNPPGQYSVTVTGAGGVSYTAAITRWSIDTLGPGHDGKVMLNVVRGQLVGVNREAQLTDALSLSAGAFGGRELGYRINIPEDAYRRILAGELPFPDPGDISTLPDGTQILLRREDVANGTFGVNYLVFNLGTTDQRSAGHAVGLEVAGDNVRVLAGPSEAVSQQLAIGLGVSRKVKGHELGARVSINHGASLRYYELAYADIAQSSGQAAYEQFIRDGTVPQAGQSGVVDTGTVRKLDFDDTTYIGGSLSADGFRISGALLSRVGIARNTAVRHADGSEDVTWLVTENHVNIFERIAFDPSGATVHDELGFTLDSVHPSFGRALGGAFGQTTDDRAYDLQLTLDEAQYQELRDRALDSLEHQRRFPPELIAKVREGSDPYAAPWTGNAVVDALLSDATLDDFLRDARLRNGGPNTVADGLLRLYADDVQRGPLPGDAQLYPDEG